MKLSILASALWVTPSAATGTSQTNLPACEDFNTGVYHGVDVAEYLWWNVNGGSCSSIWGFEDQVEDYLEKNYPTDTSNWRTNSCNQGVEAGAEQVVDKYEQMCLAYPDECVDLGNAAAQQIAFAFCPFNAASGTSASDEPDYKAECRTVAYGICEGAMYGNIVSNGCDDVTTSELSAQQDKCKDQIDSMTGGSVAASFSRNLRKLIHF